jgi:hypothetical protein
MTITQIHSEIRTERKKKLGEGGRERKKKLREEEGRKEEGREESIQFFLFYLSLPPLEYKSYLNRFTTKP